MCVEVCTAQCQVCQVRELPGIERGILEEFYCAQLGMKSGIKHICVQLPLA